MPVNNLEELSPETRDVVESYLARVTSSLSDQDTEVAEETRHELLGDLMERLNPTSSPADAAAMVSELGLPEYEEIALPAKDESVASGTLLGVPYEFRLPNSTRAGNAWWDPASPRLFKPRIFGLGWSLNFGALAVKLGLIEPDAEDEPFAGVPDSVFALALLLPLALTAAVLGSWLAARGSLPAQLPVHWNWRGAPDRWSTATSAWLMAFTVAALPTAMAWWSVISRSKKLGRASFIGLACMMSTLAVVVWANTLFTALAGLENPWFVPAGIVVGIALAFAVMTAFARMGRAAEIRRDLYR